MVMMALVSEFQQECSMKKNTAVASFLMMVLSLAASLPAFADENHQHSNDCRNEPTRDKFHYCNAMNNKDASACDKIGSFELKSHCLILVADHSRSNFHSYKPITAPAADK